MATKQMPKSLQTTDGSCGACAAVKRLNTNLRCNAHKAGAISRDPMTALIQRAEKAGHVLTGTPYQRAQQAQALLGAKPTIVR